MTTGGEARLPERPLGRTGLVVSALGFGVSGPHASPITSAAQTAAILGRAIQGGVTLFDTAPFYGDGEAERRLGAALESADRPAADIIVSTKVGTMAAGPGRWRKDFSSAHVSDSIDDSRRRLGLDTLPILLLHGPSPDDLTPALLHTLSTAKRDGRIRLVGVAGRGAELDTALNSGAFDVVMAPVHAGLPAEAQARLARARDAGLGVLGIEALGPGPRRWSWPPQRADLWYAAREAKRWLAGGRPELPAARPEAAEDALRSAFSLGLADAIVTTTTRPEHLRANMRLVRAL